MAICVTMLGVSWCMAGVITHTTAASAAISSGPKIVRAYHRGLSNAITNVSRYSASGRTHRNGTTAISWEITFVVANSNSDPHAGNASQSMH
jgi:hypothetical protein